MNKIILVGRLAYLGEDKLLNNGTQAIQGSIAVNRNYKNSDGSYEADFINFSAYGNLANLLKTYFNKGDRIGLIGRLQVRTYTNQNNERVTISEVIVENLEFLQDKKTQPSQQENNYTLPDGDLPF